MPNSGRVALCDPCSVSVDSEGITRNDGPASGVELGKNCIIADFEVEAGLLLIGNPERKTSGFRLVLPYRTMYSVQ